MGLKWLEAKQQWVLEHSATRRGQEFRLFRRLPKFVTDEATAKEWADIQLKKFNAALDVADESAWKAAGGGFLYALSNPLMPGLLKIGKTSKTPQWRCADLSKMLPVPCTLEHSIAVLRITAAESAVHWALRECRVNPRREWFRVSVDDAKVAMNATVDTGLSTTNEEMALSFKRVWEKLA